MTQPSALVLPAAYAAFAPRLETLMGQLGFTAVQYCVGGEGPISVRVKPESGYYSEARDRYVVLERAQFADRWWKRDGDLIVVFTNTAIVDLVGDQYRDWSAAEQFGVAKEKIQAVRDWLEVERKKVEDSYRTTVRQFVSQLQSQPAHASLSTEMQATLAGLTNSYGVPDLSQIADKLRLEWAEAEVLQRRVDAGECLVNFGGHFRVMGATGQTQYWVIRPDGTEREPDKVSYRMRYTSEGEKCWRLVSPDELALVWIKANTAAPHEFTVAKLPVGDGVTDSQFATVKRLEAEIEKVWQGMKGMSGKSSPPIGEGWCG